MASLYVQCATPFQIKKGDTYHTLDATIRTGPATPFNLTGATVQFRLFRADSGELIATKDATVVGAAAGTVSVSFDAADVDEATSYLGEFVITITATGKIAHAPTSGYVLLSIQENLADDE